MDGNFYSNGQNSNFYGTPENPMGTNAALSRCSVVFGFISLGLALSAVLSVFAIPVGAIALILAMLSTRRGKNIPRKAVSGIIASVAGIFLGLIIVVSSFVTLLKTGTLQQVINDSQTIIEQMYGDDAQVNAYDGNWL